MENLLLHLILGDCIKLCSRTSHLCISNGHHVGFTNETNRYSFGVVMYLRHWKMSKISFETRAMLFIRRFLQLDQLIQNFLGVHKNTRTP